MRKGEEERNNDEIYIYMKEEQSVGDGVGV